jgi:DNA-binding response OmpR family regulator
VASREHLKRPELTPTESRLMAVMSDGQLHTLESLKVHLNEEEYSSNETVQRHISNLRTLLRPKGKDIVNYRGEGYRMVRLLNTEE